MVLQEGDMLDLSYFMKGTVEFQFCSFSVFTISPSFGLIRIVIYIADADVDAYTDYIWHDLIMLLSLSIMLLKHVGPSFCLCFPIAFLPINATKFIVLLGVKANTLLSCDSS